MKSYKAQRNISSKLSPKISHYLLKHFPNVNRNYNKFDLSYVPVSQQKTKEFYKFLLYKVKTRIILFYSILWTSISSFVNENHPWAIKSVVWKPSRFSLPFRLKRFFIKEGVLDRVHY